MRLKKGFTLAEILIVLMVIGVIATMTIPSMMKGVTEAQLKTGFKKAYNTVTNLTAMERTAGGLPATAASTEVVRLYQALNSNLSVTGYVNSGTAKPNDGKILASGDYDGKITIAGQVYGSGSDDAGEVKDTTITTSAAAPWITTEDGFAYTVIAGGAGNNRCGTKLDINGQLTQATAVQQSCAVVVVDVNGLSKGPNHFDVQVGTATGIGTTPSKLIDKAKAMDTITGDQFLIFVGSDGATAGPKTSTVSGRIAADLK